MLRQIRSHAYCIDGVLDVDWDISPIEDMFFIRDGVALGTSEEEQLKRLALNCLTRIDPQFSVKIKKGNILVGNKGVGWGHGHDHAALALKAVGISAILCETTGANFKRNCINHGLPIIEIPGIYWSLISTPVLSEICRTVISNNSQPILSLSLRFLMPEVFMKKCGLISRTKIYLTGTGRRCYE
jgi:hypothetical protein